MLVTLTIAGGVALILHGVQTLRKGLDRLIGRRLGPLVRRLARSRLRAFMTGIVSSLFAPSSTTMSVLAVQTVREGHLTPARALAILLGADIGLTVTVQLMTIRLDSYAPILVLIGVLLGQFTASNRSKAIGLAFLGIGLLFLGIHVMRGAAHGVTPDGDLLTLLEIARNYPLLVAAIAMVAAVVLQSSTVTIALLIGVSSVDGFSVPLSVVIAWVLGANVGIALTTLLIGWQRHDTRRLALGNLLAKTVAAGMCLAALGWLTEVLEESSISRSALVADIHTGFNLMMALLALPLVDRIGRLCEFVIPDPPPGKKRVFGPRYISERPPDSLAVALGQSRHEILHVSEIVREMFGDLWTAMERNDPTLVRQIQDRDDHVDLLDDRLKRYLTRLSKIGHDDAAAAEQMRQLRYLAELETIGDVIDKNLCELVLKKIELGADFSEEGRSDLTSIQTMVAENILIAETAFTTRDRELARKLLRHKDRLDTLEREYRDRHFKRLRQGMTEAHETSAVHLDMLTHIKRINSCVTHVAYAILRSDEMEGSPTEV